MEGASTSAATTVSNRVGIRRLEQEAGRIRAARHDDNVVFELVGGPINDQIDDAYRAK